MSGGREGGSRGPKIQRISEKYALTDLDDKLIERYTRDSDPLSLRDLAVFCNQRILEAAMIESGMRPLEGEVENLYELLTEEDVSAGMRSQARTRLESHDINVGEVIDDFISYQTIRRYLDNQLDVERQQPTDEERKQRRIERIYSLESRLSTVTEETLDQLQRDHGLTLGEADVLVDITVSCLDCGAYAPVRELLEDGGCDCQ